MRIALESKNDFMGVTPDEISSGFDRGEVVSNPRALFMSFHDLRGSQIIVVQTLKCVGYNTQLQRDLATNFPLFVPPPKKPRKTKAGPKGKGKAKKTAPAKRGGARGIKRKREEPESEVEDSDVAPESEEEEDDREVVYRPRATRSRAIPS
jgi:hypothetical protein